MYRVWLSLTPIKSGSVFRIPEHVNDMHQNIDVEYQAWWNSKVLPLMTKVQVQVLFSSESRDFVFGSTPNRVLARGLNPPNAAPEEASRKRDLNQQNERGIKRIKNIVPSAKVGATSEHADKAPEAILIPDHSSIGDRASQAPGETVTPEDENSGDQV
ncbi:uncharacterized protein LOC111406031 isoform X2 [Olea europaea var. sylvestris]|uniref:uncharacterized protein LOC111406031 isoform X2 n=1 Tax=Olea europaea var. sylvestris TaxID=158386 RepID=UPI000C1D30C9|nr:uncharacterized protein LOC111406031 isoform X2 [Olea europaea var. sylvestris]